MKWTKEFTRDRQAYFSRSLIKLKASIQADGPGFDSRITLIPGDCHFLGFAAWHIDKDVAAFRAYISESVRITANIIERFDAGDPIDQSYVSMIVYQELLSGLAAGDFEGSMKLAALMGGRIKAEKEEDSNITLAFGNALKFVVLGEPEGEARRWVDELTIQCSAKQSLNYIGYPRILRSILDNDRAAAQAGFVELLAGHRKLSKGNGFFAGTEHEALCIWGIGLANLARWRGLEIAFSDDLIPQELLVPVKSFAE
jgi:hypothetical protein